MRLTARALTDRLKHFVAVHVDERAPVARVHLEALPPRRRPEARGEGGEELDLLGGVGVPVELLVAGGRGRAGHLVVVGGADIGVARAGS